MMARFIAAAYWTLGQQMARPFAQDLLSVLCVSSIAAWVRNHSVVAASGSPCSAGGIQLTAF
jgi:hypothetical protein